MCEPQRTRLDSTRPAITHHGEFAFPDGRAVDYYVTVGFYDTPGRRTDPGEVFVVIAKEGSDVRYFVNAWAQAVSISLQYGVPWEKIGNKLIHIPGSPILSAIAKSVFHCIQHRKDVIGEE